jgi:hypothetical protein
MTGILALLAKGAGAVGAGRNWIGNTRAAIQRPAAEMRADIATRAQSKLAEMLQKQQEAAQQRQATQQAPGLAAALGTMPEARGLASGGQIGAGWDQLPPEMAAAVRLQMDPGTRQLGNQMATGLMDPVQRQSLANARQQGELLGVQTDSAQFALEQARLLGPLNLQAERELIAQRRAAAEASKAQAAAVAAGNITDLELKLGDRWTKNIQEPLTIQTAVQQATGALELGNSLGVLAATIKLAKVLDPQSVVREGEVTTVEGGNGTAQMLISAFNKMQGKGMGAAGQAAFLATLKAVAAPQLARGVKLTQEFESMAEQFGVNPGRATTGVGWDNDYAAAYAGLE